MMEEVVLKANTRTVIRKRIKALRREGLLPAVVYGRGIESIAISMDAHKTNRTLAGVSSSQLITVDVDGGEHKVLVKEKQRDPVTGIVLHIDFLEVSMTEKLRTAVGIELVGEAPAINELGGVLQTGLEELMVECFPGDLPERISIDISGLVEIGDALYVRDVEAVDKVEILTEDEEMLVLINAPAAIEEEEEEEEEILEDEDAEPEVIERGKKEEDEEEE